MDYEDPSTDYQDYGDTINEFNGEVKIFNKHYHYHGPKDGRKESPGRSSEESYEKNGHRESPERSSDGSGYIPPCKDLRRICVSRAKRAGKCDWHWARRDCKKTCDA